MSECTGIFLTYKDGGGRDVVRFRCCDGVYIDLKPGARFCPNCGGSLEDSVPQEVTARFCYQLDIPGIGLEVVDA